MRFSYDQPHDVLYVTLREDVLEADYVEQDNGDVFRIDARTKAVVGMTIMDFKKRTASGGHIDVHAGGELLAS